jgi:hypothetical protein
MADAPNLQVVQTADRLEKVEETLCLPINSVWGAERGLKLEPEN